MIIDITGILLTPGNLGKDCLGNGKHEGIVCCCDECDYAICCLDEDDILLNPKEKYPLRCVKCKEKYCPRNG